MPGRKDRLGGRRTGAPPFDAELRSPGQIRNSVGPLGSPRCWCSPEESDSESTAFVCRPSGLCCPLVGVHGG